jgi:16S rRNA (adenine1518-N6/adenine1519-N6)-dimethyltransferase
MDLLEQTMEICRENDIWPSRSKGQNFLVNEKVYEQIVAAANLTKDDVVLEIGPGLGILTAKLSEKAGKVIAVELDDKLAKYLQDGLKNSEVKNIAVINENILDSNLKEEKFKDLFPKYKIVANLPYNITSVFIRRFLTAEHKPEEMILMLQKEVAERICAKPGDMSLLALSVQFFAEPEIIAKVPKEDFYPSPKVDSAVIKIKCHSRAGGNPVGSADGELTGSRPRPLLAESLTGMTDEKEFFRIAKFGFSAKRKMLKNNLAGGLHITPAEAEKILVKVGFNPKARAEDLSVADWLKLSQFITS